MNDPQIIWTVLGIIVGAASAIFAAVSRKAEPAVIIGLCISAIVALFAVFRGQDEGLRLQELLLALAPLVTAFVTRAFVSPAR